MQPGSLPAFPKFSNSLHRSVGWPGKENMVSGLPTDWPLPQMEHAWEFANATSEANRITRKNIVDALWFRKKCETWIGIVESKPVRKIPCRHEQCDQD